MKNDMMSVREALEYIALVKGCRVKDARALLEEACAFGQIGVENWRDPISNVSRFDVERTWPDTRLSTQIPVHSSPETVVANAKAQAADALAEMLEMRRKIRAAVASYLSATDGAVVHDIDGLADAVLLGVVR